MARLLFSTPPPVASAAHATAPAVGFAGQGFSVLPESTKTPINTVPAAVLTRLSQGTKHDFDNMTELPINYAQALKELAGGEQQSPLKQFKAPEVIDFASLSPQQKQLRLAEIEALSKLGEAIAAAPERKQSATYHPGMADTIAQAEKLAVAPTPVAVVEEPVTHNTTAAGGIVHEYCPYCGWEQAQALTIVPTTQEWIEFEAMLHGARLYADHVLYDGGIRIKFRSLTFAESELALEQCGADYKKEPFSNALFEQKRQCYRMAMGIESIMFGDEASRVVVPTVDKVGDLGTYATGAGKLYRGLRDEVLISESLHRMVLIEWAQFSLRLEVMEARRNDPNFQRGVGPAR